MNYQIDNIDIERSCGSCTKCCDGWLSGTVNGFDFGFINDKRVPCNFVEECSGCTIYENRPKNPCKKYNCEWLTNKDIPENFKPSISNVIITKRGYKYYEIVRAGETYNKDVKEWFIEYAKKNNFRLTHYEDYDSIKNNEHQ